MDAQEKKEEIKSKVGSIIMDKPSQNEIIKELRELAEIITD